jgi:hypothetical protein
MMKSRKGHDSIFYRTMNQFTKLARRCLSARASERGAKSKKRVDSCKRVQHARTHARTNERRDCSATTHEACRWRVTLTIDWNWLIQQRQLLQRQRLI